MTDLTPEILAVLGVVAMLIVQGYKLIIAKWTNVKMDAKTLKALTAIVSLAVALFFVLKDVTAVDLSDPMTFVGNVVLTMGAIYSLATLVYKWLFKEIADDFGMSEESYLKP